MRTAAPHPGRRRALVAVASVLLAAAAAAAVVAAARRARSRELLLAYVASAGNNHVQVIDLASGRTLRKLYTGATPWRLVASPDRKTLWVQHWFAATTVVVGLDDHEVRGAIAARGPGAFGEGGDAFLTFDWPSSALRRVDARTLAVSKEKVTEIRKVYDVVPAPGGDLLYLAQFDPMAKGPRERYGYVLAYPYREADPARAAPRSYRTGQSPAQIRVVGGGDFLVTADRETNGLSLVNRLGDGRAIPTCAAPQAVVVAPDETRMVVACWRGDGAPASDLVAYRTDFRARPWPTVEQVATAHLPGGLVAGTFAPAGDRIYVVDRTGNRLLELDPGTLRPTREIATGDVPLDVVVLSTPERARDRLAAGESRGRTALTAILTRMKERLRPVRALSWTEVVRWKKPPPRSSGAAADASREGTSSRRLRISYLPPDSLRTESEEGSVRLAQGGHAVWVDAQGHYWVTPRQDLAFAVHALASLSVEEAIRQLAGDVPGSPFLRAGIAVDLTSEVRDGEDREVLIGAFEPGERVTQLWVDAATGRPTSLVERFPTFAARGHGAQAFGSIVETKFREFARVAGGGELATRLERVVDGQWVQEVAVEGLEVDPDLDPGKLDPARLGGTAPPPAKGPPPKARPGGRARDGEPGRPVSILPAGYLSGPPRGALEYNSNPPTSGPRLPYLADWGVHRVPVPLELQVHNLEHGGVIIQYSCPAGCADQVRELEAIARGREWVLLAPYPLMPPGIALTAWGRIDTMEALDAPRIERFIAHFAGKDRHSTDRRGEGAGHAPE